MLVFLGGGKAGAAPRCERDSAVSRWVGLVEGRREVCAEEPSVPSYAVGRLSQLGTRVDSSLVVDGGNGKSQSLALGS